MYLSKLTLKDEMEFISFHNEFVQEGGRIYPGILKKFNGDFAEYLALIEKNSDPLLQPEWRVSDSTYVLKDSKGRIYGMASLRHRLTDELLISGGHIGYGIRPSERGKGYGTKLLFLLLPECFNLGIDKVLITCDKNNHASAGVIKNNGGILENEIIESDGNILQRYWITLKRSEYNGKNACYYYRTPRCGQNDSGAGVGKDNRFKAFS